MLACTTSSAAAAFPPSSLFPPPFPASGSALLYAETVAHVYMDGKYVAFLNNEAHNGVPTLKTATAISRCTCASNRGGRKLGCGLLSSVDDALA